MIRPFRAVRPTLSRRRLLACACGTAAALAVPALASAATPERLAGGDLAANLQRDGFASLLNQYFYVTTRFDGVVALQLVEVRDARAHGPSLAADSVTLVFLGSASARLPEGIYTVEHDTAGRAMMRLEREQHDGASSSYRAQFCLFA
jgi:hypothetical protein